MARTLSGSRPDPCSRLGTGFALLPRPAFRCPCPPFGGSPLRQPPAAFRLARSLGRLACSTSYRPRVILLPKPALESWAYLYPFPARAAPTAIPVLRMPGTGRASLAYSSLPRSSKYEDSTSVRCLKWQLGLRYLLGHPHLSTCHHAAAARNGPGVGVPLPRGQMAMRRAITGVFSASNLRATIDPRPVRSPAALISAWPALMPSPGAVVDDRLR